jgi:ABC-type spermidine/putrescine transport system permease subunit II
MRLKLKPTVLLSDFALALVVFGMLLPAVLIMVMSLDDANVLIFPPQHWGVQQYRSLFSSHYWIHTVLTSFKVAIPAATAATIVGTCTALAIRRSSLRLRSGLGALALIPLLLPAVAYAFALYTMLSQLHDLGSYFWLVSVHAMLGLPFVTIITGAALTRIPVQLEIVAMTLGASRARAVLGITVRLLAPAMAAGFIFAFLVSFDDATFVSFLGGPGLDTLPNAVFESLKTGLDPTITAIATILMLLTAAAASAAVYFRGEHAGITQ